MNLSLLLLCLLSFIGLRAADILPEGPVDAVQGKNVTIRTLVEKADSFIIWNFSNGKEQVNVVTVTQTSVKVNAQYEGRVSVDRTNGNLALSGLKTTDSGDYSINLVAQDGTTQTAEIKLRVLVPVANVAISSSLPEAIEHNSTVVLTCTAQGSFLKFTWFKGATPIIPDEKRITVKEEEASSKLTIAGVLRSDLAEPIYCTAANKLETEKSAAFNLTVYYGPEEVTLTPSNPSKSIRAGSNFSLSCSAVSDPPATFTWYHGQSMIDIEGPVVGLEALEKLGLGKKMEEYSCRAKNAKTQRIDTSSGVSFVVVVPISGVTVTGPTAILIAGGNATANLSCQAAAGSVESKKWQKDGKPLAAGGRVTFSEDMSSVMISPLQKEDNGEYTCELANAVTTEKASYKMVVNYGPEKTTVSGEEACEVKDKVVFTCGAESVPPATYTWKFNGTVIPGATKDNYVIDNAIYKNTGKYTCEAHNSVTGKSSMSTHNLSVKEEGALDEGLSDGAIAGIVIAVLVALGAAVALIIYCRQKVPVESPY